MYCSIHNDLETHTKCSKCSCNLCETCIETVKENVCLNCFVNYHKYLSKDVFHYFLLNLLLSLPVVLLMLILSENNIYALYFSSGILPAVNFYFVANTNKKLINDNPNNHNVKEVLNLSVFNYSFIFFSYLLCFPLVYIVGITKRLFYLFGIKKRLRNLKIYIGY